MASPPTRGSGARGSSRAGVLRRWGGEERRRCLSKRPAASLGSRCLGGISLSPCPALASQAGVHHVAWEVWS